MPVGFNRVCQPSQKDIWNTEEATIGFLEDFQDLGCGRQGVDHITDTAQAVDGIKEDDGLRNIGQADGEDIALLEAHGQKPPAAVIDFFFQLPEGHAGTQKRQGFLQGSFLADPVDQGIHSLVRNIKLSLKGGIKDGRIRELAGHKHSPHLRAGACLTSKEAPIHLQLGYNKYN